ncbi:MAG: DNA-3-methyladenine glycosylase [Opitutaceae bacterium]|jgi:DNA-3-methyladenine glycosylase
MSRIVKAKALRSKKTVALARGLLGKFLVRGTPHGPVAAMITEVEAYDGEHDRACHARNGRTARNAVMYRPGGVWYVYLCYGVHELLNLVTGPRGYPAAMLIRGVAGASGPGRLTKALKIDRGLNGAPATPEGGLWIEDRGVRVPRGAIQATPRIGVSYAGPVWAKKPWRFVIDPGFLSLQPSPRFPARTRR